MKKVILGLVATATLISGAAMAGDGPQKNPENEIQARMLEQVLNSIERASVDLNINDITISSDGQSPAVVKTNDLNLHGMINFSSDWSVDLVRGATSEASNENEQVKKLFPKLQAGAKNLTLAVDLKMNATLATINAKFFSGYDERANRWLPRPLVLKVTNQLNKNLLTIRVHSLSAKKQVNAKDPKIQDITGTCVSDKTLFDFTTGENRQVPVDCRFSGYLTQKGGYKISFKYATE
ncbi:MAG: hypothetical protein ACM3MG_03240 [Bacillota bacterium]